MLLKSILLLAPLVAAAAERGTPNGRAERDVGRRPGQAIDLSKRTCSDNGCACEYGYAGVICARCPDSDGGFVVWDLGTGSTSDVYQCDGTGGCCDYGYADDCANGATGRCG